MPSRRKPMAVRNSDIFGRMLRYVDALITCLWFMVVIAGWTFAFHIGFSQL